MKTTTTRFGPVEFKDEALLTFPAGIIGFPGSTRYVLLDHERDAPFKWLQSLDESDLAFVIVDPMLFKPDYRAEVAHEDIPELAVQDESDLDMFVLLTIPPADPGGVTANLRGPILVNHRTRLATQVILEDDLPIRYPLFSEQSAPQSARQAPTSLAVGR